MLSHESVRAARIAMGIPTAAIATIESLEQRLDEALIENRRLREQLSDASWRESERRPVFDSYGQFTETWR